MSIYRVLYLKHITAIKNILLVDSNNLVRDGLQLILESCGYTVDVVNSKDAAMDVLNEVDIDLMISDVNLETRNNGLQLTNITLLSKKKLPVIMLTMYDDPLLVLTALSIGVKGYLLKDNCGDDIIKAIAHIESGKGYLSKRIKDGLLRYASQEGSKVALDPELMEYFDIYEKAS